MAGRILHVLSQRPSRTGSGVTLEAIVEHAARRGWTQAAAVGVPVDDPRPRVGGLPTGSIHPLTFAPDDPGCPAVPDVDFPVPGMSDVMPYRSSVWSALDRESIQRYRTAWTAHLRRILDGFRPDLIHTNHLWLVSALVRETAPDLPVVATCHATGLRQRELCPGLVPDVDHWCRRIDRFCVLREDHRWQLARTLAVGPDRITVIGAGYRDDVFRPGNEPPEVGSILYVGKYSGAKGLPWLLDAVQDIAGRRPGVRLHVAGAGSGEEADRLRDRMDAMAPLVRRHGQLEQEELAGLMRRCEVCVLPSFYEGVPLVLVEAAVCGCRLVATALPGVVEQIAPAVGSLLTLVPVPPLEDIDRPAPAGEAAFARDLGAALQTALDQGRAGGATAPDLGSFTWTSVFGRVERIWEDLLGPDLDGRE